MVSFLLLFLASPASGTNCTASQHNHAHSHHGHVQLRGQSDQGVHGHLHLAVIAEDVVDSSHAEDDVERLHSHGHLNIGFRDAQLSIISQLKLEEFHTHDDGQGDQGDRVFDKHTLAAEALYVHYQINQALGAYVGKFNPATGFDEYRSGSHGVLQYLLYEENRPKGMLGLGAEVRLTDNIGSHHIDISAFQADRSFLSETALYATGHTHYVDGGAANTSGLESFSVEWQFRPAHQHNLFWDGLCTSIATSKLAQPQGEDDTWYYQAGLAWEGQIGNGLKLQSMGSADYYQHLHGEDHTLATYTLLSRLAWQQWHATLSRQWLDSDAEEPDETFNGGRYIGSVGYTFDLDASGHIAIEAAYLKQDKIEGESLESINLGLTWHTDF